MVTGINIRETAAVIRINLRRLGPRAGTVRHSWRKSLAEYADGTASILARGTAALRDVRLPCSAKY